jgi:hypothetical protein
VPGLAVGAQIAPISGKIATLVTRLMQIALIMLRYFRISRSLAFPGRRWKLRNVPGPVLPESTTRTLSKSLSGILNIDRRGTRCQMLHFAKRKARHADDRL